MRLLVFAAVLALAACMPQAPQQQQQGSATTTTQPAPSSKPGPDAAVETTPILDREFLVGRWGDNGDCSKDVTLSADGSFTSYTGGDGQWSLEGTTMRMAGKQNTQELRLELINQNTIRITNPGGSIGTSQRCE
jgi:hypothetical protein